MVKFKISEISDGLFILFTSFLISFVLSFYFLKNNVYSILLSIAFSVCIFCFYTLFKRKKKGKLSIKREDEERFIKCVNAMCLLNKEDSERIIFETLLKLEKNPVKVVGGIVSEDNFFYSKFSYDKISVSDIIKAYKRTPKGKNLNFIGVAFSPECEEFISGFFSRITLIPFSEVFPLIKKADCIPDGGFIPQKQKIGFFNLLKSSFSRKKARTFALYGFALIIMSNFVFFPLWYIISGCCFLLYSLIIKFFAPKPTANTFI